MTTKADWKNLYPLNTFHGETKRELVKFINTLLSNQEKDSREETIEYIAGNEGWEESGDIYRKHFGLPIKYPKK